MKTKNQSLKKSEEFLLTHLKNAWKEGDKIPGCRTLARQVGVSLGTMQHAIKKLERDKKLVCKANVGIYVGSCIPRESIQIISKNRGVWENLKELMKNDILHGAFRSLEFVPSLKELAIQYGANFRTLQKAISALVDEKLLTLYKRRYRILHFKARTATATVVCIMDGPNYHGALWSTDRLFLEQFLQSLEHECSLKNIRLHKHCFGWPLNIDNQNILGFIVWHSEGLNNNDHAIAAMLSPYNKPVAVLLYIGSTTLTETRLIVKTYSAYRNFFVSDLATETNRGKQLGQFLLDKGHTRVFSFVNSLEQRWIKETHEGIVNILSTPQNPDAVVPIIIGDFTESERALFMLPVDKIAGQSTEKDLSVLDSWSKQTHGLFQPSFAERLEIQIAENRFVRHSLSYFTPLFRKALTIGNATAWVFFDINDAGHGAIEFCKMENIKVPQQIGIVNSTDMPYASFCNLTAYRADYAGVAAKMLAIVLYPEYARRALCIKGTNIFTIDGMVIDRGSA